MQVIADDPDQDNFTTGPSSQLKSATNVVGNASYNSEDPIIETIVPRMVIERSVYDDNLSDDELNEIVRGATREIYNIIVDIVDVTPFIFDQQ